MAVRKVPVQSAFGISLKYGLLVHHSLFLVRNAFEKDKFTIHRLLLACFWDSDRGYFCGQMVMLNGESLPKHIIMHPGECYSCWHHCCLYLHLHLVVVH